MCCHVLCIVYQSVWCNGDSHVFNIAAQLNTVAIMYHMIFPHTLLSVVVRSEI